MLSPHRSTGSFVPVPEPSLIVPDEPKLLEAPKVDLDNPPWGNGMSRKERDAFGHWLAGFTAGEGCFICSYRWRHERKNDQFGVVTKFQIAQRDDDRAILEKIKQYLGVGFVNQKKSQNAHQARQVVYTITDRLDIKNVVIPFFDLHCLVARKYVDYTIWRECVLTLCSFNHKRGNHGAQFTKCKIETIIRLSDTLVSVRKYPSI